MSDALIKNIQKMLASGQDNAVLRFGLGKALLDAKEYTQASEHFAKAVQFDPDYSAAWKLYAKALVGSGQTEKAIETYCSWDRCSREKRRYTSGQRDENFFEEANLIILLHIYQLICWAFVFINRLTLPC